MIEILIPGTDISAEITTTRYETPAPHNAKDAWEHRNDTNQ